jgi:hypothetical protein
MVLLNFRNICAFWERFNLALRSESMSRSAKIQPEAISEIIKENSSAARVGIEENIFFRVKVYPRSLELTPIKTETKL